MGKIKFNIQMIRCFCLLFLFIGINVFSQNPTQSIQQYLENNRSNLGLTQEDISDWIIESEANSNVTGITNYQVKQRYQGIEIDHALTNFSFKNSTVFYVANRFESTVGERINTITPVYGVLQALQMAYQSLGIVPSASLQMVSTTDANHYKITSGIQIDEPVLAKLVYQITDDNRLRLAWNFTFYTPNYKNLWYLTIDAVNGAILQQKDLVLTCNFGTTSNHSNHNHFVGFSKKINKSANYLVETQSGSYNVFPYNTESPNHGPRQLISNPHDIGASPFGWHDTNGVTGAEFTITRGNNVWAREDIDGVNSTVGASPNGGAALLFDFPYTGTSAQPSTYTNAATTNLFYMNNMIHDIFYKYGFDEANGNFQQNNYGNPGTANDFVIAESQDGGGTNNANFSTPIDGFSGRMQMFLWNTAPQMMPITITSPAVIAGNYAARDNNFSPGNVSLPFSPLTISSNLILYNDGIGDTADACTDPVNGAAMAGKIVLLKRGDCTFVSKVLRAQNAGATAVIVVNNVPGTIVMGGDGTGVTIPALSVTQAVGNLLINQLQSGPVFIVLQGPEEIFVNSDGSFDNGIIAHEYGHGISNRLTGGANNSSCLNNEEQMGEGWSDWFALMLQMKTGDVGSAARGIGTFAIGEPITGGGIRPYPYSTNFAINPLTFDDSNFLSVPHGVGSVWATMLWDLTWAYVNKYGFNSNIFTGNGGNNKVLRLVLDAMKIQPCNPTFVEGRNALIAADQATTGGADYCMIWSVFAARGLGVNASSGLNDSASDQTEDFTTPAAGPNCILSVSTIQNQESINVFPNPSNGKIIISYANYVGKMNIQVVDLNGRIVYNDSTTSFDNTKEINLTNLNAGVYIVKIETDQSNFIKKIIKN